MKIFYEFDDTRGLNQMKLQCLYFAKEKYKILWALRHLEDNIENDDKDGVILIPTLGSDESTIVIRGFSDDLRDKVWLTLNTILKPVPPEFNIKEFDEGLKNLQ